MRTSIENLMLMSDSRSDVTVRPASTDDLPRIVELQLELGEHHRELEPENPRYKIGEEQWTFLLDKAFENASSKFLVAVRGEQVCGFVRLSMVDKPWGLGCEMETLVVDRNLRSTGIGKQLLERAEAVARQAGARAIRANVLSRSTKGRRFYRENGYSEIAVRFGKPLE
jgi:ribosomal protein S18 acetylase RimI-like enzyme